MVRFKTIDNGNETKKKKKDSFSESCFIRSL